MNYIKAKLKALFDRKMKSECCTLVWNLNHVNKNIPIFRLNRAKCTANSLNGISYINQSEDYTFTFGSGIVGKVWATQQNEVVTVAVSNIKNFHRKDIARLYNIKYVTIAYIDNNTIIEFASSDEILDACDT